MIKSAIRKLFFWRSDSGKSDITILYGGKSGNAAFVANEAGKQFVKHGLAARVVNMSSYPVHLVKNEKMLLIVASTHGEGDPPPSVIRFYNYLFSQEEYLGNLQYSVCALGDSSYEFFCKTGKDIDERLNELGASRFYPRADCDAEFGPNAVSWITGILNQHLSTSATEEITIKTDQEVHYHNALIKEKYRLNEGSSDGIYHLVLGIDSLQVSYQPGDSIGVIPQNPCELVTEILKTVHWSREQSVIFDNVEFQLGHLLQNKLEITTLRKSVICKYQQFAQHKQLEELISAEDQLNAYLGQHDLLDLLIDFPCEMNAQEFVSVLPGILPRYYSIASSQQCNPAELHLTVKQVQFNARERTRKGSCSTYLNQCLQVGTQVQFKLMSGNSFRLPEKSDVPVILIASGTGIAPFRAFLQERELQKSGDNWLIFGEKHQESDFLYQKEIKKWLNHRVLTRFDPAFSRDDENKIYVQDKIHENADEIYQWLNKGACIYVCGSLKMGMGVRQTILKLYEKKHKGESEVPGFYLDRLIGAGRYREDLY